MSSLARRIHAMLASPGASRQLGRFLAGGALAVVTDYTTFALLIVASAPLLVASILSFLAGFAVSFTVNKLWVFEARKETQHHGTRLQVMLYLALLVFNMAFTYYFIFFTSRMGFSVFWGKVCTIAFITAWNFVLYKKVIFRLKPQTRSVTKTSISE